LVDEAWIPVLGQDGAQREVSLMDAFRTADKIRMIACELPTQTFAILRLMLAILHRATNGPPDFPAWRDLWASAELPADVFEYLNSVKDRFDLLNPQKPFYQVPDLQTSKNETFGLERIIADVPNGHPYLTARAGTGMQRISIQEAARWVVHCQAFDTAGIKSGAIGDPRVKAGKGYGIGVGSAGSLGGIYIEGTTLRETLLLNLVPADRRITDDRDTPAWEREIGAAEESVITRGPFGVLNLYTYQSRRLRLYGGRQGVTGAMVANGDKLEWQDLHRSEPMSYWGRSGPREKAEKREPIYLPRPHDPSRALWRGLATLLSPSDAIGAKRLAPVVMGWLDFLASRSVLGAEYQVTPQAVSVIYGSNQAVIAQIFGDSVTMNMRAMAPDSPLRTAAVDSVDAAEQAVRALRILAINLARAASGSGSDNGAAEVAYSSLDQTFRRWLAALRPDADPVDAKTAWQREVGRVVARLGSELVASAGPKAWVGRTIQDTHYSSSQAEAWFRRSLSKALPLAAVPKQLQEVQA
jgi:CRISPR system Cascade subunit CasA